MLLYQSLIKLKQPTILGSWSHLGRLHLLCIVRYIQLDHHSFSWRIAIHYAFKIGAKIYIAVERIFNLLGLGSHPAKEVNIWTKENWWVYSLKLWIYDYLLSLMPSFILTIQFFNLLLSFIRLFKYLANALVF